MKRARLYRQISTRHLPRRKTAARTAPHHGIGDLRLGDPATGEELGITPPLSSASSSTTGTAGCAAAARGSPSSWPAARRRVRWHRRRDPDHRRVTRRQRQAAGHRTPSAVRPSARAGVHGPAAPGIAVLVHGLGVGDVLSPDGLILTNAHVAEPQAPGLAVAIGEPRSQLEQDPPYLTVELTTGPGVAGQGQRTGRGRSPSTATSTWPSCRSTPRATAPPSTPRPCTCRTSPSGTTPRSSSTRR